MKITKTKKEVDEFYGEKEIKCECGWIVKGTSENHAKSNLKIHKESKKHKILMDGKND